MWVSAWEECEILQRAACHPHSTGFDLASISVSTCIWISLCTNNANSICDPSFSSAPFPLTTHRWPTSRDLRSPSCREEGTFSIRAGAVTDSMGQFCLKSPQLWTLVSLVACFYYWPTDSKPNWWCASLGGFFLKITALLFLCNSCFKCSRENIKNN